MAQFATRLLIAFCAATQSWCTTFKEGFRWLADELGRVRDLEVLVTRIGEQAGEMGLGIRPVLQALSTRRKARRLNLHEALASERYTQLLDAVVEYLQRPSFTDLASEQCRWLLPRLAGDTFQSLTSSVKALNGARADEQYHEVRIQAKRVRYTSEAVGPYLAKPEREQALRLARRAETVQNILGDRQDCVLIRQVLLEATADRPADGAFNLAVGRLVERQHQLIENCEADFERAWARLDRKKYRAWLNG